MKIVVVFARQRFRGDRKSIKIEGEAHRLRLGRRLTRTLEQHGQILLPKLEIRKSNLANAAPWAGPNGSSRKPYSVFTEIGPFSVDSRMSGVPLPYSIRRWSSSQVLRASPQMLAWQLIG